MLQRPEPYPEPSKRYQAPPRRRIDLKATILLSLGILAGVAALLLPGRLPDPFLSQVPREVPRFLLNSTCGFRLLMADSVIQRRQSVESAIAQQRARGPMTDAREREMRELMQFGEDEPQPGDIRHECSGSQLREYARYRCGQERRTGRACVEGHVARIRALPNY